MNKFKQQVSNINWLNLNGINDPINAYKSFLNKFNEIYEDCFPNNLFPKIDVILIVSRGYQMVF